MTSAFAAREGASEGEASSRRRSLRTRRASASKAARSSAVAAAARRDGRVLPPRAEEIARGGEEERRGDADDDAREVGEERAAVAGVGRDGRVRAFGRRAGGRSGGRRRPPRSPRARGSRPPTPRGPRRGGRRLDRRVRRLRPRRRRGGGARPRVGPGRVRVRLLGRGSGSRRRRRRRRREGVRRLRASSRVLPFPGVPPAPPLRWLGGERLAPRVHRVRGEGAPCAEAEELSGRAGGEDGRHRVPSRAPGSARGASGRGKAPRPTIERSETRREERSQNLRFAARSLLIRSRPSNRFSASWCRILLQHAQEL